MKWKLNEPLTVSNNFASAKILISGLLWICMIWPAETSAQTFYSFSYYKIAPGKEHELRRMLESVDYRVQQARVNREAITSWYLYEVLSPTGSSAEYDRLIITTSNSFKNIFESPYTFDSALKKTFPEKDAKFFADYYSRQMESWKLIKQEVYAGMAVADSSFPAGSQLKYIVSDFMQPKPGMGAQYVKSEIDTFRLVHKERVKLDDISQWALLQLAMPFDMKIGYSYLALNFYKDLDRMFGPAKYGEGLKKAFPNADLNELFQSASVTRDNPRAEILRLVLYALPVNR